MLLHPLKPYVVKGVLAEVQYYSFYSL